jgi:hypothetical protein
VAGGVAADAGAALGVALDGESSGAEAGALDGDGAAPGAYVPDEISGAGAEPGEDEGADLGFRNHGGAMLELLLGKRPPTEALARAGDPTLLPHYPRRIVDHDDVRIFPLHRRYLPSVSLVRPLLRLPETLGDDEDPVQAGEGVHELRRPERGGGEDRHLRVRPADVGGASGVASVGAHDYCVVPGEPVPREGAGNGRDRREDP